MRTRRILFVGSDEAGRQSLLLPLLHGISFAEVVYCASHARDALDRVAGLRVNLILSLDTVDGKDAVPLLARLHARSPSSSLALAADHFDPHAVAALAAMGRASYVLWDGSDTATIRFVLTAVVSGAHLIDSRAVADALPIPNARHAESDGSGEPLSAREQQVLQLTAAGLAGKEIAVQLAIHPSTVGTFLRRATNKLGARNRAHLIAVGVERGILSSAEAAPANDVVISLHQPPR